MSVCHTLAPVVLEPAAQAFAEATAQPPYLYELTPAEARGSSSPKLRAILSQQRGR